MMSVHSTPAEGRRGYNRNRKVGAAYIPFTLPEGLDAQGAVRAHLRWLLANMDYFARRGPRELQTASLALQRDLAMLGLSAQPQVPDAAELAARFCGPDARAVAEEVAQLNQLRGKVRTLVENAWQLMNDWGLSGGEAEMVSPDVERKSRSDAKYLLVRAMKLLDGKPEWG